MFAPPSFRLNSCLNSSLDPPRDRLGMALQRSPYGKGPMDGIGGTATNTVFRKVLSSEVVIGSPEDFARYVNKICQVDSLYLPTAEIPDKPEDVQDSSSIPDTLKTHRMVRGLLKHKIPYLKFYYMSTDPETYYTQ